MQDLTAELERESQLATLDRLLQHNIRNEVNTILGRASMIAKGVDDIDQQADTIQCAADRLLEQADKERKIIDLLTDVSTPQSVDLTTVIDTVLDTLERTYPEARVTVETPDVVTFQTVPEIERAIEEVVENAIVHTDSDAPDVTVTVEREPNTVELRVADRGSGIPAEERDVLGDEVSIEPLLHSEGMGLWLVKRICTRAGGTVRFAENDPRGSVVTLVISRTGATVGDTRIGWHTES